jgi:hypothetical protein
MAVLFGLALGCRSLLSAFGHYLLPDEFVSVNDPMVWRARFSRWVRRRVEMSAAPKLSGVKARHRRATWLIVLSPRRG